MNSNTEYKECGHRFECGCDKQYCVECEEEPDYACENEECKHYYACRNDNCNCRDLDCLYCNPQDIESEEEEEEEEEETDIELIG